MKVAIMQPYFMPYLGYFQLIHAVDTFIFYDDVNFIKKGFIHRNSILVQGEPYQFTIPIFNASQNKLINETSLLLDDHWINRFYKTLEYNYKNASYFEDVFTIINNVFNSKSKTISQLAIKSVKEVCHYLDLKSLFQVSSEMYSECKGLDKADRLISIVKRSGNNHYINAQGGKSLYDKDYFERNDVKLSFIENQLVPYKQFNESFVPNLSIIDVLMFNSKQSVRELLKTYKMY